MNSLLKKLKEFGLVASVNPGGERENISISHALKKADIPVALFHYSTDQSIDHVKVSNENEDMFIGAQCPCSIEAMERAMASGAHFIFTSIHDEEVIRTSLNRGYDLIIETTTEDQIDRANNLGVEAVSINCDIPDSESLIQYTLLQTAFILFIRGEKKTLPFHKWRTHNKLAAFVVDDLSDSANEEEIYADAVSLIHNLLGIQYSRLSIRSDTSRLEEAETFASLTAIPLFRDAQRDLLTINVADMDRTIAYLKWKNIYMDPLSAKMKGDIIVETELCTEFLGWSVKLVNCP